MSTIDNITFDDTIYSRGNHSALILHQKDESNRSISLPNAQLMTFLQPFKDMILCQNYIKNKEEEEQQQQQRRHEFTLFAYSENIYTWLWNNNVIPQNLNNITIFCLSDNDKKFLTDWARRYTQRVKEVITCDKLERELLFFGMKFIEKMRSEYHDDEGILNLLDADHTRLRLALMYSLMEDVNRLDNDPRMGVQPA
ncbi:unnamed protein product [Adineta steineri]|uniref:Uncharacterized protein n=1 Tax=Adineta steineri TaxID=433720 RepID=A0A814QTD3_9BILA|nr:unnamed protein product [Adineta steineri]CAF3897968.1 unnamed protein product [Adineta steineri]